jgi:hypothetical protein
MSHKAPAYEVQGIPASLQKSLNEMLADDGLLHVVSDNIHQAEMIASQMLELKRVFEPVFPFPFYQEGLPENYGPLVTPRANAPFLYQQWRKRPIILR